MIKITMTGAVSRLILTGVVGMLGSIELSVHGKIGASWHDVFTPDTIIVGVIGGAYAIERYMNTSWARANQTTDAENDAAAVKIADNVVKAVETKNTSSLAYAVGITDAIAPLVPPQSASAALGAAESLLGNVEPLVNKSTTGVGEKTLMGEIASDQLGVSASLPPTGGAQIHDNPNSATLADVVASAEGSTK